MTNANDSAMPFISANDLGQTCEFEPGLSKREYFAAMAMQGLLSSYLTKNEDADVIARISTKRADALIKELNK